ncbi:DNA polymerase I [Halorhodospira halophila]|uniref:DNA polymerase I n=1 Tax=Halorhodospira halophila (strain DSM 244 / SL1) TaxID=349124 RepID=A1WZS2_HALHL|nr:DNA polymerase I [Halorhodospira halophila]ABM63184.1 DNA polymerase I [Halorhodospira halophila SL1]MBK1729363.1 DNA polymerase I [Halorhodospira halophila]
MTQPDDRLVLVDGSSYLYRAFHALPALTNANGEPTGALYGVVNMLHKLLAEEPEARFAVVFDAPGKTFRDELFEQYKAHRPPMPDELRAQREPLKAIIAALGVPVLEVPGVEADDVIGTLAARASGPVLISTTDKDMAQLVDEQVTLLNTMSGTRLDPEGVREKFGVPPELIRDYLALVGDTSDNIPGVPKVGPKTAAKWLNAYGSLDALREQADEIRGKVGESLRAHLDELPLSVDLVTIRCDLALEVAPEDLVRQSPDRETLGGLYQRYGMRRFLAELQAGDAAAAADGTGASLPPNAPEVAYEVVLDDHGLAAWMERLRNADAFSIDLETNSLNYMDAEIVGVSLAVEPGQAAYLPVAHCGPGAPDQLDRDRVLDALRPLLEAEQPEKMGQNLKYDMSVLARYGIELRGVAYDSMLESYVLDSTATRHDMDSLASKYLGVEVTSYEQLCGKGVRQVPFAEIDVERAGHYAAEDADIALRLHQLLYPRLQAESGLLRVFSQLEMPLLPVLSRMERHGVRVDCDLLERQSEELAGRMAEVEQRAHEEAGEAFNLGSPKQIQEIFFERMGLPVIQRTPKGQPSTAESVLEELSARGHELPRLILEHRGLSKLKSTYTDKLPQLIHRDTGRVHTSYHQAVAATGRLSSSDPNLQNIPVRTPEGRRIRKAFVASPGHRLITADYSQVELRIMAHLSGDEGLRRAFEQGEDIHRATAAEVFAADEVNDEQRRAAKAINFGLIYGMSAWGLGRQLGIPRDEAQTYIDRYFERYPGVRAFMDRAREQAREQGYVETVFGRRLHVPEIHSRNRQRREYAERTAINAPMQGTAADVIKRAMIDVDALLNERFPESRLVMQVHDELVLEVPEAQATAVGDEVRRLMEGSDRGMVSVPLEVELGVGDDWEQAH